MSSTHTDEAPRLVVVSPGSDHGRQVVLGGPRALVGRSTECDIRLDDPHVSRRHASLVQRGSTLYVQDLDSTSGTYVNGVRVGGPHVLWPGDVVAFAGVELRLGPELGGPTAPAAPAPEGQPVGTRYDIGRQRAGTINNVGRDQHNSYVQHVVQQRDSFLRQVAATRTKARWLVWLGLTAMVVGMLLFAGNLFAWVGYANAHAGAVGGPSPLGPRAAVGWMLGFCGSVLLAVGIVLHVVAASRRRRIETQYALPVQQSWAV